MNNLESSFSFKYPINNTSVGNSQTNITYHVTDSNYVNLIEYSIILSLVLSVAV
jgi:hypothetical protein